MIFGFVSCYPTIIVYLQTSTQTQIKLQNYNNSNNNIGNKKRMLHFAHRHERKITKLQQQ